MNAKAKQIINSKLNSAVALFLLCLFSAGLLFANENPAESPKFGDWKVVGPSGGDVRVVAVDPKDKDRLYVSTLDGQIHTSADGGTSWHLLVNLNRPQLVLDQLFVDSRDSKIIYTSGHRHKEPGGFFKTTDGGLTWKEAKELRKESIHSMVQSISDPDVLMVGTINGVWVSKSSGDDWEKIPSDTMPVNIGSLAIDPRNADTVYAGTWWRAYKTTDSGKSWRLIKNGMIDDSDVFAITIDQKNPDHVVASACSGIYESFNKGEKWEKIQGIPAQSRRTRDILQHPSRPKTVFAATTEGFWMTSDGGKSWALTTQRDLEINSIAVHADEPDRVFIGTNNYGVMVSNDGGKNFTPTNENFTSRFTYSITTDAEDSNRLYATTQNTASSGGFVFVSNNAGTTWQQAKNLDVGRVSPFALMQDRTDLNMIYLGTNIGLFRSLDRGNSWEQVTAPKPPAPVKKKTIPRKRTARKTTKSKTTAAKTVIAPKPIIAPPVEIAPAVPGRLPVLTEKVKVLAQTQDGKNGIFAGTDKGLYRTYDIAKGWEKISFGVGIDENIFVVYSSPLQPEMVWVGTAVSGVIVSRDNGATWQKVGGAPDGVPISSIAISAKQPENMYIGTSQTFYASRDGGKTWTRRGGNLPLGNYTSILINPHNPDEIYTSSALEADGGIYFSDDAGWNWKRIDSKGMKLASRRVWSMAFDPDDSNRIFAGTHSSGVYRIDRAVKSAAVEKPETIENKTRPRVAASGN
ncbi:MAG TPA: YCF48-related protein [Pyrinomonadaceae bacterium]|nr:YCF48-related protein [Pyrinomonadaceae bacterium]